MHINDKNYKTVLIEILYKIQINYFGDFIIIFCASALIELQP